MIIIPSLIPADRETIRKVVFSGNSMLRAEEEYYKEHGRFTTDLVELANVDERLEIDPGVTLTFLHVSDSGFTIYVNHRKWHREKFEIDETRMKYLFDYKKSFLESKNTGNHD